MIVMLAIRIGMQAGQFQRKLGVVNMRKEVVPSLTIATWVLSTGALVGPLVSRRGVAAVTNWVVPFDCDAGYSNWQYGWSPQKKAWCCEHASKACSDALVS